MYTIKKIIILILVFIIIGVIVFSIMSKKNGQIINTNDNTEVKKEEIKTSKFCYYRANKTDRELYDTAWLRLNITGEKVTGEFYNLPAEKDSKIGSFEGTMEVLDDNYSISNKITVWWNALAEGTEIKEELIIDFGGENATVGFGEMINRGDGVYIYKNKTNLYWIDPMGKVDCESLDEKLFIEKYIRDNIKTIATNKEVLGGSWYVISMNINPETNTGEIVYEDGHIQSKASVIYTYEKSSQSVIITKFEVKE